MYLYSVWPDYVYSVVHTSIDTHGQPFTSDTHKHKHRGVIQQIYRELFEKRILTVPREDCPLVAIICISPSIPSRL